jgi:hypothetical protein
VAPGGIAQSTACSLQPAACLLQVFLGLRGSEEGTLPFATTQLGKTAATNIHLHRLMGSILENLEGPAR